MWKREIEEEWSRLRESYRDSILFFRLDGLYFIRGDDVPRVASELDLHCSGQSVGFDEQEGRMYMRLLARRGLPIVEAVDGRVRVVDGTKPNGQEKSSRPKRKFIAVEPSLLFAIEALIGRSVDTWLRQPRNELRFNEFKGLLQRNDWKGIREHGEIYVFEVASWYERYLTTLRPSDVLLLARAGLEMERKLNCWLVQPKAWRDAPKRRVRDTSSEQPVPRIEQLRLL
jgi:hypothetical protein